MKLQEYKLANNLPIVLVSRGSSQICTVLLLIKAGSIHEAVFPNGTAHFLEHAVFKGTKSFPGPTRISHYLDELGLQHNAFTAKDHTGYWIKGHREHIVQMLQVLSELVQLPLLENEQVLNEKKTIQQEIHMYEDAPMWQVAELAEELYYQTHILAQPILGTKTSIDNITQHNLREFMRMYYHPSNAVLTIAGDFGALEKDIIKYVEDAFSSWKDHDVHYDCVPSSLVNSRANHLLCKQTEQVHIAIALAAPSYHDEKKYAARLCSVIMGGGMSSLLYEQLRETHGLAYTIDCNVNTYEDYGSFLVTMGVGDVERAQNALSLVCTVFDSAKSDEVVRAHIQKAKSIIKGSILMDLETCDEIAEYVGKQYLFSGKVESPNSALEKYEAVSVADIVSVMPSPAHAQHMALVVVGRHADTLSY